MATLILPLGSQSYVSHCFIYTIDPGPSTQLSQSISPLKVKESRAEWQAYGPCQSSSCPLGTSEMIRSQRRRAVSGATSRFGEVLRLHLLAADREGIMYHGHQTPLQVGANSLCCPAPAHVCLLSTKAVHREAIQLSMWPFGPLRAEHGHLYPCPLCDMQERGHSPRAHSTDQKARAQKIRCHIP